MEKDTKVTEIKTEIITDIKVEKKEEDILSSIFITEDDKFTVDLDFYKDNGKFVVEGVDDVFDVTKKAEKVSLTLKYPSQADSMTIYTSLRNGAESVNAFDMMRMEITRLLVLVRSWSLSKPLNNENMLSLNPNIIRGLILKIREVIGFDSIT